MRRWIAAAVAAGALVTAAPAGATVSAVYEGQYTRGSSHSYYFRVTNNPGASPFYICYYQYAGNYNTMSSLGCYTTGLGNGATGYFSYTLTNLTALADGTARGVCAAQSYGGTTGSLSCSGSDNGRIEPKIDNHPPTITLGVGGASDYTNNTSVPITIGYADTTSPPWNKDFAQTGDTIVLGCVQQGADINAVCTADNQFTQYASCAQTIVLNGNSASFNCNSTLTQNGKWWACVRLTDAAHDNTHGTAAQGYPSLSNGGNLTETCSYITVDTVAPSIGTTTAMPSTPAPGQSVAFATSATDATSGVKSYAWNFGDGGTATGASANHAYSSAGSKTATVTVTDNAGNTSTKQVSVNVVAPDTTAPDTNITAGPSGSTTDTSAQFSFTSTENPSTFECKLDAGSYAACTSPKSYTGLAVGSHTFSVRAKDGAGNTDGSPAARAWTITAPAPPPGGGGTTDPGAGGGTTTDPGSGGSTGTGGGDTTGTGSGSGGDTSGAGSSSPSGVTTTGSDAPSGGSATGTTQVTKQIAKVRTRTLSIGGLTVTVPRTVGLAKGKHKLLALLRAAAGGKVRFVLRHGAAQMRTAKLTFHKAGSAGFAFALGNRVAPGNYFLDVAFLRVGTKRTVTKTFSVKLTK